MPRLKVEPETGRGGEPGIWQATHIFYAANPQPLLLRCVRPLIASLREEGLLNGYFFINYWLEGPHVRLRLQPSSKSAEEEVRRRTDDAVEAFLKARPALYQVDSGFLNEFYNTLFDIEFPAADREDFRGPDGRMNLRANNSSFHMPYEPEYGKYGGSAGIALAEWHFAHSSDLVMDAMSTMNLHLRTVLLGTSAQLMMVMASVFLPDRNELADYLDSYYEFWQRAFPGTGFIGSEEYARNYEKTAPDLGSRFTAVRTSLAAGQIDHLPAMLRSWAVHCRELRDRAAALSVKGELVFQSWDGKTEAPETDPNAALRRLLSPYMHMTNNRLHVTIRDEAYLSHVLGRVLREPAPAKEIAVPDAARVYSEGTKQ